MRKSIAAVMMGALISSPLYISMEAAHAATETIREDDFITALSDTRSTGEWTFRADSLEVRTTDSNCGSSQNKAAEYWSSTGSLPDAASLDWTGTSPQPGGQLVFDYDGVDGNSNDYNILVFEPVYGDNVWLTNGSSADAKAADPSGAENGGNGSEWFGTLPEWKAAMPDARLYAAGFSLGSGVCGQGVIDNVTLDDTEYRFTNQAEPPTTTEADVTGSYTAQRTNRNLRIVMQADEQPPNTTEGDQLNWRVRVNKQNKPNTAANSYFTQGFGDRDVYQRSFGYRTGTYVARLYKEGVLVRTWTIGTNRR